jgi:hypothetical protein
MMRAFLAAVLLLVSASPARTQPSGLREIFAPPSGMWLLPGSGYGTRGKFYGPSSPDADWVVDQWNTPEDLPPFHDGQTGNAYLDVRLDPDGGITLEQNGKALSCDRIYASGVKDVHEFDLFVSPNNANRPEYKQAVLQANTNLASLRHLEHRITLKPLLADVLDTDCTVTRVTFLTSVTLSNPIEKQTLFYQLRLGMIDARAGSIATTLPAPFWFAKGNDVRTGHTGYYGFGDSITSFGELPAEPHVSTTYGADLLPRLIEIIHAGAAFGLDQDLSHWIVRGTYHGETIWGHIHARSHWKDFSLAVD